MVTMADLLGHKLSLDTSDIILQQHYILLYYTIIVYCI